MRTCATCGGVFDDDSRFCPVDGDPLALAPAVDPLVGAVLFGQFELREACGRGAMGTVYRAWQRGMDRTVAVKVLHAELVRDADVVRRFHREARAVARLQHPNIVTVHLIGETDDGRPFIVMEHVEGQSLAGVLDEEPVLEPARALRILRQVTAALAEAHAAGVVHRDLKPANLLISQHRRARDLCKVLDFGIAKVLQGGAGGLGPSLSGESRSGSIFGTPHYIAPEQASGAAHDHRVDLYSAGVLLFRMLTGRLPFDGTGISVLVAHIQRPPPRPSEVAPWVTPDLERIILTALEKDPARRFQSADELGDAVEGALARLEGGAAPPSRVAAVSPGTLDAGGAAAPERPVTPPLAGALDGAALPEPEDEVGPPPGHRRLVTGLVIAATLAGAIGALAFGGRGGQGGSGPDAEVPGAGLARDAAPGGPPPSVRGGVPDAGSLALSSAGVSVAAGARAAGTAGGRGPVRAPATEIRPGAPVPAIAPSPDETRPPPIVPPPPVDPTAPPPTPVDPVPTGPPAPVPDPGPGGEPSAPDAPPWTPDPAGPAPTDPAPVDPPTPDPGPAEPPSAGPDPTGPAPVDPGVSEPPPDPVLE